MEQKLALERQHKYLMDLWKGGLSGERLFTARMLILCGFPINERKPSIEPDKLDLVRRKAQLADKCLAACHLHANESEHPAAFSRRQEAGVFACKQNSYTAEPDSPLRVC